MSDTLEDCSLFAVDCMVVCCCCPCLLLQITVFLFIRLPQRMAVKSKKIVLRKLRKRLKKYEYVIGESDDLERGEALGVQGVNDVIIEGKSWVGDRSSFLESEKMWEEFVEEEGLFWFGSFWGTES
ncbi:uncharacterized protein LOC120110980 [Phoenix dactylifera]|uniref:Uncharacterized protein LOC120110980 n=1 Tax=Phoenix dactylifera TaxID=42345 RepID=A0A8B9A8M2_PHODC|nr:uncharacterized protein LOC120110980 [Phoenix dactylifera]